MTTVLRLRRRLGPDFDDYCFPMEDRVGHGVGPDFDDYCFPIDDTMDYRAITMLGVGSPSGQGRQRMMAKQLTITKKE